MTETIQTELRAFAEAAVRAVEILKANAPEPGMTVAFNEQQTAGAELVISYHPKSGLAQLKVGEKAIDKPTPLVVMPCGLVDVDDGVDESNVAA